MTNTDEDATAPTEADQPTTTEPAPDTQPTAAPAAQPEPQGDEGDAAGPSFRNDDLRQRYEGGRWVVRERRGGAVVEVRDEPRPRVERVSS